MWYIYVGLFYFILLFISVLVDYWKDGDFGSLVLKILLSMIVTIIWPLSIPTSIVVGLRKKLKG